MTQVFRWQPALDDWGVAQALSYEFCEALGRRFSSYAFEPRPGAVRLLTLLNEYQVPCCLCSELDERSLSDKVEAADMARFFQASICAEDGAETAEQAYLASCVKLRRPPARCVVFEDSPQGVSSAKEALAKAVALVGKHPAYEMMHGVSGVQSLGPGSSCSSPQITDTRVHRCRLHLSRFKQARTTIPVLQSIAHRSVNRSTHTPFVSLYRACLAVLDTWIIVSACAHSSA